MIQLIDVTKEFGSKTILDKVNFSIYDGEKVGVIGDNGQGKSTLLEIILTKQEVDSGSVVTKGKLGYLPQDAVVDLDKILSKIKDAEFASQFYANLSRLGFDTEIVLTQNRIDELSCGEKTKLILASIFTDFPSIIILDEPTNHLDSTGKEMLINYLNSFNGTMLVVSHDIDFLDRTVHKILEVKEGRVTEWEGNYTDYKIQKENQKLSVKRAWDKHLKREKEINAQIDMYKRASAKSAAQKSNAKKNKEHGGGWGFFRQDVAMKKLSKFASAKIKQLEHEKNKDIERPEIEHEIRYKLTKDDIKAKVVFNAQHITKSFGDHILFEDASFVINSGDKIGIVGDNGVGKTTLVNIILGTESVTGNAYLAPSVRPVLMRQDIYDLDGELTINQMSLLGDKIFKTNFLLNLCAMNIDKSRFDTKIKFLSSGEKMRIKLTQIILSDANLIILDEPTNHLDITNKEYLTKVLSGFCGSLIVISHDKHFLKSVTNRTLQIVNKQIVSTVLLD